MTDKAFNRRITVLHSEEPMRVREAILELCRKEVEATWKQRIRFTFSKINKWRFGLHDLGEGCHFGRGSKVRNAWFGNFASFGPRCEFSGPAVIGDLTMLSSEIQIIGQDHEFTKLDRPMRASFPIKPRPLTVVEADCWIGSRATIMEGVRIGRGSIVGAASVVTRSLPPYSIAAGSPAKVIRQRFAPELARIHDEFLYGSHMMETYI